MSLSSAGVCPCLCVCVLLDSLCCLVLGRNMRICSGEDTQGAGHGLHWHLLLPGHPPLLHRVPSSVCQELHLVEPCNLCDYESNGRTLLKVHMITIHCSFNLLHWSTCPPARGSWGSWGTRKSLTLTVRRGSWSGLRKIGKCKCTSSVHHICKKCKKASTNYSF